MLGLCSDCARTFSDRPRIGNDVSTVFKDFLRNLGMEFRVAGAIFGDVGGGGLLLRALYMRFHM